MKTECCNNCDLQFDCKYNQYNFPKHKIHNVSNFIEVSMQYRLKGFFSFRGHRNRNWDLGVRFKLQNTSEEEISSRRERFKQRCLALPKIENISEDDEWRWMFFAQHFGLATKLLDWSSNPLVALYFSVENIISKVDDKVFGVVWGLKVNDDYFLNPVNAGHPDYKLKKNGSGSKPILVKKRDWYMINPPPINRRIENQSGKFSYHPDPNKLMTDNELLKKRSRELVMFCIVPSMKDKNVNLHIRKELGIMNIHHASMFPDPSGIANFLNFEIRSLDPDDTDPSFE